MMKAPNWSSEEDEILFKNKDKSVKEIALILGRTIMAVHHRKNTIGLTKKLIKPKIGEVFAMLTVVGLAEKANFAIRVLCKCECGNTYATRYSNLRNGTTTSCGCFTKEKMTNARLGPPGFASFRIYQNKYIRTAKKRGLEWKLTEEDFKEIVGKDCFWCGAAPALRSPYNSPSIRKTASKRAIEQSWIAVNGIDRVNNSLGYLKSNSVPCCTECNLAKLDRTAKQFFEHCKRVLDHLSKKMK
ncbi:MAG: hypothetical protein HC840_00055 [Leptolyngbyaceae cyanobacterium RM2_2_4]|nr:hypothetical protein [Leptolyngbyaceae cyanobacterium RM2_2_4]